MNSSKTIGLGEPAVIGKKSLFQPPRMTPELKGDKIEKVLPSAEPRVRMTLEITKRSLSIIQEWQSKYRLDTGHPLSKWKIISEALELYEQTMKGKGSEK